MSHIPSENDLRKLLKEGQTLYQISRQFNTKIPEIFKLGRSYGISFAYDHNHIPNPTKQDLESMYHDEHLTQYQISREFDVSESAVKVWIRKHIIPTRGTTGILAVPMPSKEVLERMYIDEGMTKKQIASEFNVADSTIGRRLSDYDISTVGRQGAPINGSRVLMPPKDDLLNHINEGLNQHQIAKKYNVCDAIIFKWCNYYDIPGMVNCYRCMTHEHQEWKFAVFERDHRTCQMCGETNAIMHPHHIVPYCDHPEIAYELENGITLCKQCHESIRWHEYEYLEQFAAITQPHLRDHEVIESMPWEPALPLLSDKLFPDYPQGVIA